MFLDQLLFIYSDELSFLDNELSADDRVIHIGGLAKNDRGNRIVHACVTDTVEVDGEKVRAFSSFEGANIITPYHCCAAACAKMEGFACGHEFAIALTPIPSPAGRWTGGESCNSLFDTRE